MYKTKTVRKPDARITEKQKKFLSSLINKKYQNKPDVQQVLILRMQEMTVQEASIAINTLLMHKNCI